FGLDPHNSCPRDLTRCLTGNCNGIGACAIGDETVQCGVPSCTNTMSAGTLGQYTGATLIPRMCDGVTMACPATPEPCLGDLVCASASTCRSSCRGDHDCISSSYCTGPSGTCEMRLPNGQFGCTSDHECQSRVCRLPLSVCRECTNSAL